jgi:endogenous inhibitor of DNA gyrase (YacG/DUF329 family)
MTVLDEHSCPTCDTPVTVTTRNPNRRYCSPGCKALGWRRRAKGLPENSEHTPPNGVANDANGVANGANPVDAVANGEPTRTVQACPHCRQPISLITLIVPPAAAFVTVPDPPTTATTRRAAPTHHLKGAATSSNNTALDSQPTPPPGPVSAAEISTLLHQLGRLRSPARHDNHEDHTERADVLTHKAELFDRIADQHTGTDQAQARQAADRARAAAGPPRVASAPKPSEQPPQPPDAVHHYPGIRTPGARR